MSFDASAARLRSAVERGRRRVLGRQALREGVLAVAIGMGGLVVLLTAGTRWFPAWLLVPVGLAGVLAGVVRWRRGRPSGYWVAQRIDRAWATNDQLATAYYFLDQSERSGWVREQRERAESVADRGDVASAFPYEVPGSGWALGAVTLLAVLMLVIRAGSQETFSLDQSLAALVAEALLPPADPEAQSAQAPAPTSDDEAAVSLDSNEEAEKLAVDGGPELEQGAEADGPGDEFPEDLRVPEVEGLSFDQAGGDEMAPAEEAADGEQGEDLDSQGEAGEEPADEMGQEGDSLLDRLQDAFQNMLSSMNMEPPQMGPSSEQGSGQKAEEGAQAPGEGQEVPGAESSQEGAEASGEQASSKEIGEQFSVEEGAAEGEQQQGETSVATAGSGEGSKEMAEARREEAMGELTELYQQRAEEIEGEFTIETGSARQAARTPYSPNESGHRDPGAVLSRDEIPIAYRSYVQRYFQTVREKAAR